MRLPFAAQLDIAPLFRLAKHTRKKQVNRQPQSPKAGHRRHGPFARGISRSKHSVKNCQYSQTGRPTHIHNRCVAEQQMNNPKPQHHRGDYPKSSESEMHRVRYHPAASARCQAWRFIFSRRICPYATPRCPPNLATETQRITLRLDELSGHSVATSQITPPAQFAFSTVLV